MSNKKIIYYRIFHLNNKYGDLQRRIVLLWI